MASSRWRDSFPGCVVSLPTHRALSPAGLNAIAWCAFAVVVATGIWNIVEIEPVWSSSYGTTLIVKFVVVAASGATAALHSVSHSRAGLAVFGALSGVTALTGMFFGVLLAG